MVHSVCCTQLSVGLLLCNGTRYHEADHELSPEDTMYWVYLAAYTGLVLGAGVMSGLTIGLISLDTLSLKVLRDSGSGGTQKYARRLFPLIKRHHWLLVTLLLSNAVCVEAMPIFLDRVSDPVTAVVVSVTAVLFFGEVIPQAICTRYGLAIGYYLSPFVYLLMALLSPVAYPLSKFLDCIFGSNHETVFKKEELRSLLEFHGPRLLEGNSSTNATGQPELAASSESLADDEGSAARRSVLSRSELTVMRGALRLSATTAAEACTPADTAFMLSDASVLSEPVRLRILASAHSRIPVFHRDDRGDIRGHLLTKMLLMFVNEPDVPFSRIIAEKKCFRPMPFVHCGTPLYDLLSIFQQGKSHMAAVVNDSGQVYGLITLENVLECLLLQPIRDEADEIREEIGGNLRRQMLSRQMSAASKMNVERLASVVGLDALLQSVTGEVHSASERTPLLRGGRRSVPDFQRSTSAVRPKASAAAVAEEPTNT